MKRTIQIILLATTPFYALAQWSTSGTAIFYGAGNVGIGTTTPLSKLQIADGTGGEQLRISRGSGEVRFVQEMGLDNLYLYNKDASKLYMFWKENGNVGIGTNVPQSTLDVSGRIKAGKGPLFVDWTYE